MKNMLNHLFVTGASGFIENFISKVAKSGNKVFALQDLKKDKSKNISWLSD